MVTVAGDDRASRSQLVGAGCLVLLILGVAMISAVGISPFKALLGGTAPEWGNVPQWFSAIGTEGALILALYGISRGREYRQKRELAESDEARQAQARRIAAVVDERRMQELGPGTGSTAVQLINGSDEPVYRLVVGIVYIQGAAPRTLEDWLSRSCGAAGRVHLIRQ